ncbi:thiolase domain-containing protein [Nocardioides marmoribigeumensis]|uniref:Acetyl-CoA acetyltransferase n=1 Tax=Nocardioides marmoribigeumensis TaxID=433649 RepID=A0ABU2C1P8_9ACTN|nr:thiolase domain-containing protein [Nocardioides marmoribigeumensis]MDR7364550.1 acetyl-CoA acetyltransferase [Nocardioides marmoribigeumensis]
MRDVAVVGFAQRQMAHFDGSPSMVELLVPTFAELWEQTGWTKDDIGFFCSGSSDYLAGRSFSFVSAVDAIGTLPPVNESHVEMDAAWALYEAWVKIQTGEVDTALVYGFGKSSAGVLRRVLSLQLDPYVLTPLWPDTVSIAAMQARVGLEAGRFTEEEMAEVVARSRNAALDNPYAVLSGAVSADALLKEPMYADPLRKHDCAPVTDGVAAIVIAAGDRASEQVERRGGAAWITGIQHRIDAQNLSLRSLDTVDSLAAAGAALDLGGVDLAELHAPFSHQELMSLTALGLGDDVTVNPSGGPLAGNPMFTGGLNRIGEAARRLWDGSAGKAVATATSGPAMQQNLVCTLSSNGGN